MPGATRRQNPHNGKLITTWKWASKSGKVVEIPVRMSADTADGPVSTEENKRGWKTLRHRITDKVRFGVFLDKPKKIEVVGTDIEVIRKTVFAMLGEVYELNWEPYYIVKLEESDPWDDEGAGFRLEYEEIEMAQEDGKWMWRRQRMRGYTVEDGQPETGRSDDGSVTTAVVPATEGNTAALESLSKQIRKLREHVSEFFTPDKIQQTLKNSDSRLDPYTVAHLTEAEHRITKALDAAYVYNTDSGGGFGGFRFFGFQPTPADDK